VKAPAGDTGDFGVQRAVAGVEPGTMMLASRKLAHYNLSLNAKRLSSNIELGLTSTLSFCMRDDDGSTSSN